MFTLNLAFTQDDLNRFYASGSNVVIGKQLPSVIPNVAWLVFSPLLTNSVEWEEQYGIYASTAQIQNGVFLQQLSQTNPYPAEDGMIYTFLPAGYFGPPAGGGMPGSYKATNQYNNLPAPGPGYLTFGLYQSATINGNSALGNAVSAATVIYQSTATMTPFTTVYLWIQSQVKSNTVVTNITSPLTEVDFGGPVTTVSLQYDATTGRFDPVNSASAEALQLRHHQPVLF